MQENKLTWWWSGMVSLNLRMGSVSEKLLDPTLSTPVLPSLGQGSAPIVLPNFARRTRYDAVKRVL
jgi:hypothetical protein